MTGAQRIDRYGPGGFVIAGAVHTGPVLILPGATLDWQAGDPDRLDPAWFQPVLAVPDIELLILGTGRTMRPVPAALRALLKEAGIGLDAMASDGACRTFGVLLAEQRRVAAALYPLTV